MKWPSRSSSLTPLGARAELEPKSSSANVDPQDVIAAWRREQIGLWKARRPARDETEAALRAISLRSPSIYLYDFTANGEVVLVDKPQAQEGSSGPDVLRIRAEAYARFFNQVVRSRQPRGEGLLALEVADHASTAECAPFFAFQKPRGGSALLMVDVDALIMDFYDDEQDRKPFADKEARAIFVGSTSGSAHTRASVEALTDTRLRAGVFFREDERVHFRLPMIVQCLEDQAADAIRSLGFGVGPESWQDQLRCKILLSFDGNGAACSRVARALKSNSVLMKHDSDSMLYYFSGLKPWLHYVPFHDFADVVTVVQAEIEEPGFLAPIAAQGALFFDRFLSRDASQTYAAGLIEDYFAMLVG